MTFIKGSSRAGTSISLMMGREGPLNTRLAGRPAGRVYTLAMTNASLFLSAGLVGLEGKGERGQELM